MSATKDLIIIWVVGFLFYFCLINSHHRATPIFFIFYYVLHTHVSLPTYVYLPTYVNLLTCTSTYLHLSLFICPDITAADPGAGIGLFSIGTPTIKNIRLKMNRTFELTLTSDTDTDRVGSLDKTKHVNYKHLSGKSFALCLCQTLSLLRYWSSFVLHRNGR